MISPPPAPASPLPDGGVLDDGNAETIFDDAIAAANDGDYGLAATKFRTIIAEYPNHTLASASVAELFWAERE